MPDRIEMRLDPATDAALEQLATQFHITRSAVVRLAIVRLLEEQSSPQTAENPRMRRCRECKKEKPIEEFKPEENRKWDIVGWCRECYNTYMRNYRQAHQGEKGEINRQWRLAHPGYTAKRSKRWREENPEREKDNGQKQRAKKRIKNKDLPLEDVSLRVVYERDEHICHLCEKEVDWKDATCDHLVPFSAGGEHSYKNVKLAHRICNSKRQARPVDVARVMLNSSPGVQDAGEIHVSHSW